MIFMPSTYRRNKEDTGQIIAALEAKLTEYPGDEDLSERRVLAVAASEHSAARADAGNRWLDSPSRPLTSPVSFPPQRI